MKRLFSRLLATVLFLFAGGAFLPAQAGPNPPAPPDVSGPPAEAVKTSTGLASKVLKSGSGLRKPGAHDTVTVHYSGWTTNGKLFDSTTQRNAPASFELSSVIKGWTEGLQLMVEGEKRRFWIPARLAYGNNSKGDVPRGMLVFDVELLSIKAGGGTTSTSPPPANRSPDQPASQSPAATVYKADQSPIDILKEQSPNLSAWVSATLDTPIPEAIWENVTFLKESLRDEAASAQPKASAATYGFALRLCAIILDDLAERKVALTDAGGDAALHQGSQLTEARRDHLTWPMYALERDERGERQRWIAQHGREMANWARRTNAMRYDLGVWYDKFREGLRQGGK